MQMHVGPSLRLAGEASEPGVCVRGSPYQQFFRSSNGRFPLLEEKSHVRKVEAGESQARPLCRGEVGTMASSQKCVTGQMSILRDAKFM